MLLLFDCSRANQMKMYVMIAVEIESYELRLASYNIRTLESTSTTVHITQVIIKLTYILFFVLQNWGRKTELGSLQLKILVRMYNTKIVFVDRIMIDLLLEDQRADWTGESFDSGQWPPHISTYLSLWDYEYYVLYLNNKYFRVETLYNKS